MQLYMAASETQLQAERKIIGAIARGEMAVASAFDLKAKYIVYTVGPTWEGVSHF